ncbi:MAG: hypothetical protein CFE44_07970 [Burkholderiales bacterium PBB4]|nr:MAG: hypothetical protein CFE44_07970 [Burkholderiales bacterium PBB4]
MRRDGSLPFHRSHAMQNSFANARPGSRRQILKSAAQVGLLGCYGTQRVAWGQAMAPFTAAPIGSPLWRAASRVGYGPSPALLAEIRQAATPQAWALAQVDLAWSASRQAPQIAPEIAGFNAALPVLFEGAKNEREARKLLKAGEIDDGGPPQLRRMDFSGLTDPVHFSRTMVLQATAWRLTSASRPELENPLLARLTEFWFNHLNVFVGKGSVRPLTGHYLVNVARAHALGKFEDLLLASARHPAMLGYLDQAQSVAEGSPAGPGKTRGLNENYARELMELHTLGVDGGYTQADVRELARVLTGWTIAPQDASGYRFAGRLHDTGRKRVLDTYFPYDASRPGEQEGVDAIRMLARHPATARRVCLRLAKYFVADEPPDTLMQRLAQSFSASQGDLKEVVRTLLQSPEFWDPQHRLFKTPQDYAFSALVATQGATAQARLPESHRKSMLLTTGFLSGAGQALFGWQTPDGYAFDAGTWLVPEALTRRADFALSLARGLPALDYLDPLLGAATREAIAQENVNLRAGMALASPEFMWK